MKDSISFTELFAGDTAGINRMSGLASSIVKEYYDPIIGAAQNDYMIEKFQSVGSISNQLESGKRYFFVLENGKDAGFMCFFRRNDAIYLSKLYLKKIARGKGYSRIMLGLIAGEAEKLGLSAVELNVNKGNESKYIYEKLGFQRIRAEKNDIGGGFFMDDYVYRLEL